MVVGFMSSYEIRAVVVVIIR